MLLTLDSGSPSKYTHQEPRVGLDNSRCLIDLMPLFSFLPECVSQARAIVHQVLKRDCQRSRTAAGPLVMHRPRYRCRFFLLSTASPAPQLLRFSYMLLR